MIPVLTTPISCGGMLIVSILYKSNSAALSDPLDGTMSEVVS